MVNRMDVDGRMDEKVCGMTMLPPMYVMEEKRLRDNLSLICRVAMEADVEKAMRVFVGL